MTIDILCARDSLPAGLTGDDIRAVYDSIPNGNMLRVLANRRLLDRCETVLQLLRREGLIEFASGGWRKVTPP